MTNKNEKLDHIDISDRIQHLLDEIRVILPGTEVLFAFLLIAVFSEGFDSLDPFLKYVHLASLGSMAIATILLIGPPAYDRIAAQHESIQEFYTLATRMVLLALIFLALGLSGNIFVVVFKVTNSYPIAGLFSGAALILSYIVWFGFSLFRKTEGTRN